MRLSTDATFAEDLARATIAAALEAGVTVLDTARSYGPDAAHPGENEKLLSRALQAGGAAGRARIVTKGGMARVGDRWIPDGRGRTILSDCEASLAALDGIPIDLYLVHAPDPRTSWRTTLRALDRLVTEGMVRRVGLANVNRGQLEEALTITDVAAVQVALSPFDQRPLRGGLVERCEREGIGLIAHSPLGGPRRAAGLKRRSAIGAVAAARGATHAEVALGWLLGLSPVVVPIPGARTPEHVRSAVNAAALTLDEAERATVSAGFDSPRRAPSAGPSGAVRRRSPARPEVVMVMGIPGAGKSGVAEEYVERGYMRLNRDLRGGTMRELASSLDQALAAGAGRIVLDNTYLTRAARSYAIQAALGNGASIRCVWIDIPLAQAQVNLVQRMLDRFGRLPPPEELKQLSRREPGVMMPTSQMRALRELEPPSIDEGLDAVEVIAFARTAHPGRGRAGVVVAEAALSRPGWESTVAANAPSAPHLLFDWRPGGSAVDLDGDLARLRSRVPGKSEATVCPHGGGPPSCWCRPPLPGLLMDFAGREDVDLARSVLIGTSTAHRTLATTLGAAFVQI